MSEDEIQNISYRIQKYDISGKQNEEVCRVNWMENVKGLQHIGIPTNDIAKTVEFYKNLDLMLFWKR